MVPEMQVISCKICKYIGKTQAELKAHMRRDHKKQFFCSICFSAFSHKQTLMRHLRRVHVPHCDSLVDPLYIPDSNNSSGLDLKVSISNNSITSVKDYTKAQRVTARTIGRKKSKRIHECSICNKRFKLKHQMKRHMNVHKNPCKQCDMIFDLKKDLKVHENKVHGRPFHSCTMCPFVSEYRKNFMRHLMEIHGNEEWITCRDCNYIGVTRDDWEVHMKREHKKKFFCFHCCTAFSRKVNTRSHMLWKHPQ